jgi:hypothetical protein
VAFKYQLDDYYNAPRQEIRPANSIVKADERIAEIDLVQDIEGHAEITCVPLAKGLCTASRQLQLSITSDNDTTNIDLGQILRGRRYAYPVGRTEGAPTSVRPNTCIHVHSAWKVLTESGLGLVSAKEGIHMIQAKNTAELLALLGKLYPESITVMKEGDSLEVALVSGKGLSKSGRFIIQTKAGTENIMPS